MSLDTFPRISRLVLNNFRNYSSLNFDMNRNLVALVGENGAGKTNILEAISLFCPGRGMRRSELSSMVHQGKNLSSPSKENGFSVSITVETEFGEKRLGLGVSSTNDAASWQRIRRIDGQDIASTTAFAEFIRLIWLTPDMDGLFRGAAGERRRFLDRLVLAIDSGHGTRVQSLERALRSRNRLLEESFTQYRWLDAIEREIAELGIAVALARKETVDRLTHVISQSQYEETSFPFSVLELQGDIDQLVAHNAASDCEEQFQSLLHANRARDKSAGRTLIGPQTSDLAVRHGPKDMSASASSTGEQKALLVGIILAHAELIKQMSGISPLVLLDEITAHLDPKRRLALISKLENFSGQVWVTGADKLIFQDFLDKSDLFEIQEGKIHALC